MTQAPPTSVRSYANAKAYLLALTAAPNPPKPGADLRTLDGFARQWLQSPPEGLEASDLASLAWSHKDGAAFERWTAMTPPSAHLLLLMSLQSQGSRNAALFQQWPLIRSGLLSVSLAPWRNCLLGIALGCKHSPSAMELLSTVAVDAPLPVRGTDIQHWLWKADNGTEPQMEYTRPLHRALLCEDFQTVQWLLDHGADPWQPDSDQRNALHALDDHIAQSERMWQTIGRPGDKAGLSHWRDRLFSMMQSEVLELGTPTGPRDSEPARRF